MIKPEAVESGYFTRLSDDDKERFRSQFRSEYKSIGDEEAKDLAATDFRNNIEPKHTIFKAVKNAFHPDNEEGHETEYEAQFTSPLHEVVENPADLLLIESNRNYVNLCFVVCEAGGEFSNQWPDRINKVYDVVVGHEDKLLNQLGEEVKEINHVQYVTATLKEDCQDVEFRFLKPNAPKNYSIWSVDDDYEADEDEVDPPLVQLKSEFGYLAHSKLDPLSDGIDYLDSKNTEIHISLTTPPIIALQETLMTLLTRQHGTVEEPREFDKEDFVEVFKQICEVGPSGNAKERLIKEKAEELLGLAKDAGVVYYGNSDNIKKNRDFRAVYKRGPTTEGLRESVKSKILDTRIDQKKAERAYEEVKGDFEPQDQVDAELEEFD